MTKKNFVFVVLMVLGGLLFSLGMCMCLLPQWNLFRPGVVATALGAAMLCVLGLTRWVMAGKPFPRVSWKRVGQVVYCVVACLVFGAGMALVMAFEGMMLPGMAVGLVGVVLLLGVIPVCCGFKKE